MSTEKAPKSPKPSPLSKLFQKKPKVENTGPLQQDKAQAQLVAAARNKSKGSKSPRGDKAVSPANSPASSPRPSASPASPGAPPPLPKKKVLAKEELLEFVFCVECGARNKTFRTQCVSCSAELEIPEGLAIPPKPKKADPKKCEVKGHGLESCVQRSSGKASFEVWLRDDGGGSVAKLSAGKLEILIEGPSGEVEPNVNLAPGDDSKVLVEYDQSLPGAYQIMVSLDGTELGDAPYVVDVVLAVDSSKCSAAGSALDSGVIATQPADFTVATRDVCGNPCVVGGCDVVVDVEATATGASSPRRGGSDAAAVNVVDRDNGAYDVTIKYPAAGKYLVNVRVNGSHVAGSPFAVTVEKPPTAGSKWQAKFEEENEARRKQREKERLAEIEKAKEKYMQHAEEAVNHARAKEAAELAEKQRLREIEEHMERMRTEEGDEVRAAVLEKVKAQTSNTIYEPVDEDDVLSPGRAGKKWAAQFNDEDSKRRAAREAERQAEIARAKSNYLDHASEAVNHALTKEEAQLAEEARLRAIEEHQREVRMRNAAATSEKTDVKDDIISGESVSSSASSDDEAAVAKDAAAPAADDESSEITPSSDSESDEDLKDAKQVAASLAPKISEVKATTPRESGRSPRPGGGGGGGGGRSARGAIPDVGGRVIAYAELKNASDRWVGELDTDNLEAYLGSTEFDKVMGLTREKFYQLPSWRRQQIKKEKGLC